MATMRANSRLQVGSSSWLEEERSSANKIVEAEAEEFLFSVRNDVDWLNEHMAEIFNENQVNVAEIFKTPGKLRGKTPRTARKANPLEARVPLSDVFSVTPKSVASPFKQLHFERPVATFKVAEDLPMESEAVASTQLSARKANTQHKPNIGVPNFLDSGYYGSQAVENTQSTQLTDPFYEPTQANSPRPSMVAEEPITNEAIQDNEERRSTEGSFRSAKEDQTRQVSGSAHAAQAEIAEKAEQPGYPILESPLQTRPQQSVSPQKRSPERSVEQISSPTKVIELEDVQIDDVHSPQSEGSSPIRPIVRKSSLNFASLPAREPLTSKKSIGNRTSRTSHIDNIRTSYYGRHTGGKSTGQVDSDDDMDEDVENLRVNSQDEAARLHSKTSTQRLQDQISMLGKSQATRPPSKSITGNGLQLSQQSQASQPASQEDESTKAHSPSRREKPPPGAFPDDEDDSWIGPPNPTANVPRSIFSPRPQMTKSHTTDVMEDIHGKATIGGPNFDLPKRNENISRKSPLREVAAIDQPTTIFTHGKSVSTSILRSPRKAGEMPDNTGISVSNPNPTTASETSTTPPKSPSRSYRGSPLKAAKDKFSSILKTSRGLFASSAAVSAEAKSNLSPSVSRLGLNNNPSLASLVEPQGLYPDLNLVKTQSGTSKAPESPTRSVRKTRASTEREDRRRLEEAREAKEAKEAQKINNQLEKARQKVKDDARVFHLEKERVAAMQKEIDAKKEQERLAQEKQAEQPRVTRSSPRKTKAQLEAEGIAAAALPAEEPVEKDTEMADAPQPIPPPAAPTTKSQIGRPAAKRPIRPTKDVQGKVKPPTVIRVDTGSQRGHQYHPSTTTLSNNLQETLTSNQATVHPASSQGTLRHKASTSSIQSKASTVSGSFKSAATKALEAAARKKEQDELAAQKKRDAKLEMERQRAAIREEEKRKEELQRRQEAERQREIQREKERVAAAADAKKAAARQAMEKRRVEMEKAKETRPPPPAVRPQPSAESLLDKALPPIPQSKTSRMNSLVPRNQEESGRPAGAVHGVNKAPPKRPLQQDAEESNTRPQIQRNGPSYQQSSAQSKRRKTNENMEEEEDLTENHPKMTAPPIRQSSARPKEMPTKSLFPSGYANVPTAANLQRSTLISQHNLNQSKPTHPLDMAQVSKAPINFAGSSQQNGQSYKTPARPLNAAGKSAVKSAKSSPRVQNGEQIHLPEIMTDSEDEDDEEKGKNPPWVDSPEIRKALLAQEGMDPSVIFGPPQGLNMEAVFSKSKDKFHKFRARTSSANWDGEDRLTQDEIRKDVEARDKLRRQGFWSFDIN